jgi:hypothetical protein
MFDAHLWPHHHQFTLEQLTLTWPWFPVSTPMLPIRTMAAAKSDRNSPIITL